MTYRDVGSAATATSEQADELLGSRAPLRASALVVPGAVGQLFVCFGTAYAIPVLFPALDRALAIPMPHLTALFSATGALYFALGMISGPLADRVGARLVVTTGSLVLSAGLLLASFAVGEAGFDFGYLLGVGVGVGLCFVPTVGAVQALCREKPALAGAVAASGIGLGTLVLPSLAQLVIDHLGWRQAMQVLSLIAACSLLAALPLGAAVPAGKRGHDRRYRLVELFRSRRFLLLYVAQLLLSIVAFVPFAHLVLFAGTLGWSAAAGGYLIALIGIGSLCGRLVLGFVAHALGVCRAASLSALLMVVALVLLLPAANFWQLGSDAALYGLGYGGVIGLSGPIVAEVVGLRGICGSVGLVMTTRALGVLCGPWAVGIAAHRIGGYDIPFLACAVLALLGALLLGELHRRVQSRSVPGATMG